MEAAKVRTDRFELGWRSIEPSKGTRDWGPSDHFVGALASHGIRALPFVWKSPAWISKSSNAPPIDTTAHEQAWRDFLRAAVARYGPGGRFWSNRYQELYPGARPLPITSWQIWNEPNLRKFFDPGGSDDQLARKYGELLRISHEAIKAPGPERPDRPRRDPRLSAQRRPARLGLPQPALQQGAPRRELLRGRRASSVRVRREPRADRDPELPQRDGRTTGTARPRSGSPRSAGDRTLPISSESTRGPRANASGFPGPTR